MEIKEILVIGYFLLYLVFAFWLIKPKFFNYDVMKMELRLFPFFFKWVGIILFVIIVFTAYLFGDSSKLIKDLFFYHLDLSLLFIVFSKERQEDELTSHLRMKSIIVAFINIIIVFGTTYLMYLFYVFEINELAAKVSAPMLLGAFLVVHLLYFYYARYKLARLTKED
jgi:hypothetical protein